MSQSTTAAVRQNEINVNITLLTTIIGAARLARRLSGVCCGPDEGITSDQRFLILNPGFYAFSRQKCLKIGPVKIKNVSRRSYIGDDFSWQLCTPADACISRFARSQASTAQPSFHPG